MAQRRDGSDVVFYIDPDTGEPHIFEHGLTEDEVLEVLDAPLATTAGRGGSTIVLGQTRSGKYLKVIYSPGRDGQGIFVVTAFPLPEKQVRALRRGTRRRRK